MNIVTSEKINEVLDFTTLINALEAGFSGDVLVPQRMHIEYSNRENARENTLLLMPAIQLGKYAGVKIVTVAPENHQEELATIQGIYYLMDAVTGVPKAFFDASAITNWRTAAASALASRFLSQDNSSTFMMIGTGALAPFMIRAHATVRPIKQLKIFGRTSHKAEALASTFKDEFDSVEVVTDIETGIQAADIICAATSSEKPLIKGSLLKAGQHIDLVGAYKPTTREADDEVILRSNLFVDHMNSALHEAGDVVIPIHSGIIDKSHIRGDLFQLCKGLVKGRTNQEEITVFKSVGHALEDIETAILLYEHLFGT